MSGYADRTATGDVGHNGSRPAVAATTGPFIVVLVRAVSQKWTGTVVTKTDDGLTHHTYFLEGAPCKVRTGIVVAPLDSILLRLGGIEPHALANAVSTACDRPDLLLGEILIQQGMLAPEHLHSALRWQVLERLNYLMTDGVAGGHHELHGGVDLIPLSSRASLHPADPMYCIMCAARLPACEPIAQRYVERVREMRLGLTGDVDVARFGLSEDEHAVVEHLGRTPSAFDELVEHGLPRGAVRRVVFALGVTQALASKGRFEARSMTVPVPPPSVPAPSQSGGPPRSTQVSRESAALSEPGPPSSSTTPGEPRSKRQRSRSLGRIQLQQRAVPRSSAAPSQPPVDTPVETPLESYGPTNSIPPPGGYRGPGHDQPPSSTTWESARVIPAPRPPPRRRVNPMLSEPFGFDEASDFDPLSTGASDDIPEFVPESTDELVQSIQRAAQEEAEPGYGESEYAEPGYGDSVPVGSDTAPPLVATVPESKRGMSLTERRAAEAHEAADGAMRLLDFKAADGHLQRALRFAPDHPDLLAKAAFIRAMRRGRPPAGDKEFYDEEIAMLREVIKDHPRCEAAHYLRGRLFMRLLRRDDAVRDFEKTVRLNPDNVDAAREIREHQARKARKRKRQEPVSEPASSFRGVLSWLGIDGD